LLQLFIPLISPHLDLQTFEEGQVLPVLFTKLREMLLCQADDLYVGTKTGLEQLGLALTMGELLILILAMVIALSPWCFSMVQKFNSVEVFYTSYASKRVSNACRP
jgi:hypothetical protein